MGVARIIVRWVAPFVVGLCLTVVAALIGAFPFIVMALGFIVKDGATSVNLELLEVSFGVGAMFAAPGTMLLGPLFYISGGSRLSAGFFALACGGLGFALMLALFIAVDIVHARSGPMDFALPTFGAVAGLITGVIFRWAMKAVEARLPLAGAANAQG